ncbi:MAG: oligoribonuclease [bacterium]
MEIDKSTLPTKFLWLDLEMTGLDVDKDLILEIAVEITDANLQTLATYESRIKQPKDVVLDRIQKNVWWQGYPQNRDDFIQNLDGAKAIEVAEREIIALIEQHFGAEPAVLAGNSIYNDRNFIRSHMKELELKLHYRMLDVSSFKVLMQAKYNEVFEKDSAHRAFEDVQASIAELQYYLDWFESKK